MKIATKKKKILVCLLVLVLALAFTGCSLTSTNYEPDPDSICGAVVGAILIFFQKITAAVGLPNFCVAIFILTVLVKLLTHPLTLKQQKSVKAMNVIQPKMMDINRRYANDPQKKQEAVMHLYKEQNISPLASCLPLLIQMPIIMVLFWGIRNFLPPTGLEQYYSFFWIDNLSVITNTTQWPYVLPLLCALTTVIQQVVSMPSLQDQTQKIMLLAMPVMFFFVSQQFPAGLCIYWIFYGLITGVQTFYINYRLKIGFFATPEEKQQKKEARLAAKNDKNQTPAPKKSNQNRQDNHTHTGATKDTNQSGSKNPEKHGEKTDKKLPDKPWQ